MQFSITLQTPQLVLLARISSRVIEEGSRASGNQPMMGITSTGSFPGLKRGGNNNKMPALVIASIRVGT